MRKEGDSNPRFPLGEYTLSRRASSATRAPFQFRSTKLSLFIRKSTYSFAFYISLTREHIKQAPRKGQSIYFKALALSGRLVGCIFNPGCCPGLGAFALSGRMASPRVQARYASRRICNLARHLADFPTCESSVLYFSGIISKISAEPSI